MSDNDAEARFNTAEVKRKEYLTSRENIANHVREIGRRIIEDSENLAFDPSKCTGIEIFAEINPGNDVTKVEYKAIMFADPRIGGK